MNKATCLATSDRTQTGLSKKTLGKRGLSKQNFIGSRKGKDMASGSVRSRCSYDVNGIQCLSFSPLPFVSPSVSVFFFCPISEFFFFFVGFTLW